MKAFWDMQFRIWGYNPPIRPLWISQSFWIFEPFRNGFLLSYQEVLNFWGLEELPRPSEHHSSHRLFYRLFYRPPWRTYGFGSDSCSDFRFSNDLRCVCTNLVGSDSCSDFCSDFSFREKISDPLGGSTNGSIVQYIGKSGVLPGLLDGTSRSTGTFEFPRLLGLTRPPEHKALSSNPLHMAQYRI